MFIIKKVINNNALLVTNTRLQEYVILSNGIAFNRKVGEALDESAKFEKKFLLTKDKNQRDNLLDLITTTDTEVFITLDKMITVIKEYLTIDYDGYQYYNLLDHLIGSINRIKEGIAVKSNFKEEDILLHEKELVVSEKIGRIMYETLNIQLTTDEIYIFAIHLNNAQNEVSFASLSSETAIAIKEVLAIVEEHLEIERNTFFYNRFLLHLKYFILRNKDNTIVNRDEQSVLYESISASNQEATECVEAISKFLNDKYGWKIINDEKLYILLHIMKLTK